MSKKTTKEKIKNHPAFIEFWDREKKASYCEEIERLAELKTLNNK